MQNTHGIRFTAAASRGDICAIWAVKQRGILSRLGVETASNSFHDTMLQTQPIRNCILKRAYRNTPLSKDAKQTNRLHSGTRSIVERVFGVLKLHYGMGRARYLGLARNQARFMLMAFAYNLKRAFAIHTECHLSTE